jgi:hypothetical protein
LFEDVVIGLNTILQDIIRIMGHSNTAHFVIWYFKNNPFNGIISLSLSGESKILKEKIEPYLTTNKRRQILIYWL